MGTGLLPCLACSAVPVKTSLIIWRRAGGEEEEEEWLGVTEEKRGGVCVCIVCLPLLLPLYIWAVGGLLAWRVTRQPSPQAFSAALYVSPEKEQKMSRHGGGEAVVMA